MQIVRILGAGVFVLLLSVSGCGRTDATTENVVGVWKSNEQRPATLSICREGVYNLRSEEVTEAGRWTIRGKKDERHLDLETVRDDGTVLHSGSHEILQVGRSLRIDIAPDRDLYYAKVSRDPLTCASAR